MKKFVPKNKIFECKEGKCKHEVEGIIFGCKNCIKKIQVEPSKELKDFIRLTNIK